MATEEKQNNRWQGVSWSRLSVAVCATLYFLYYTQTTKDWHFIDNFNLIIHEAGHSVFFFLGEFVQIAAGSIFQILVPVVFVLYFYIKKNYFSSSLLLFWVGQNIINVSVYLSDAIITQLPLLGGDYSIHDWNYLLNSLGVLKYTSPIGSFVFDTGVLVIIVASYFSITTSQKKSNPFS